MQASQRKINAEGKEIERWEVVGDRAKSQPIPDLDKDWTGYVVRHVGDQPSPTLSPSQLALRALQEDKYNEAIRILHAALKEQPQQPWLLFLLAWCHDRSPMESDELRRVERDALLQVVRSEAADLIPSIATGYFSKLNDRDIYGILQQQPPDKRTAETWERLAVLAAGLGEFARALEYVEAALAHVATPTVTEARQLLRIDALLQLKRTKAAVESADKLAISPDRLADLGDLFARHNEREAADKFFIRAMASEELIAEQRYGLATRQARWYAGERRWKILLRAAEAPPGNSRLRASALRTILKEMTGGNDAEVAGRLAKATSDAHFRTHLLIRQAELTRHNEEAANICWDLYSRRVLPRNRLIWALERLALADRHKQIIQIAENELRRSRPLPERALDILAHAYTTTGREIDSQRAQTNHRDVPAQDSDSRSVPAGQLPGSGLF